MDVTLPIDEEMWKQRKQRLEALIGADLSDPEEESAQVGIRTRPSGTVIRTRPSVIRTRPSSTLIRTRSSVIRTRPSDIVIGANLSDREEESAQSDSDLESLSDFLSGNCMIPLLHFAPKKGDVDKFIKSLEDHCDKEGVSLPIVLQLTSPSKNTPLHAAAGSDTNNNTSEQDPAQSDTNPRKREQGPAQSNTNLSEREQDPAQSDTDNNTSEEDPAQSDTGTNRNKRSPLSDYYVANELRKSRSELEEDPAPCMDPLLYFAAKEGDVDKFIKALEDHCAKEGVSLPIVLEQTSPSKNTLLHTAAESEDIVRAIIDFVPKNLITAANSRAETPLIIAARAGKTNAVELLLPHEKQRCFDYNGTSALHEAVRNRRYDVIRLLVSQRPKWLYRQNKERKSPWCLAVETGDLEVLKCLLEAPNEGEYERFNKSRLFFGNSPVHVAIMYQKKDMLTEMWKKKPWLFKLRDTDYRLPLHFAAYTNYLDGVKFMIEKFPKSVRERDQDGYLPIHVACLMDRVRIVEELLRQWPDPAEFISRQNENILHVSARHGCISTVKYILKDPKFGHLINARDHDMNTPLHLAALHRQPSVLLLLARDRRVDLKLVNMNSMTALDAVEQDMKGVDAPLRKRLTRIILQSAGTPRSRELAICKPNVQSRGNKLEKLDRLKEEANNRMVVATLVASVTFASGFSVPGGYNGSDPGAGIAILLHKAMYNVFVISNSIAMYSSIIALLILLKTQIDDPYTVRNALLKARLPLLVALVAMSLAFLAGVYVTVTKLAWLAIVVLVLGTVALFIILSFYLVLYIPLGHTHPLVRRFTDLIIVAGISMFSSKTAGNGTAGTSSPADGPCIGGDYEIAFAKDGD